MQSALKVIFPPRCISCGGLVDQDFGLCGKCWRDTPFIAGTVCDTCGAPLPGEDEALVAHCDECIQTQRPWSNGRAALVYKDNARKIVLGLKHGDHTELARPASEWMARVATPVLVPNMLIAPVPLHWTRLLKRRYNQAALLGRGVAGHLGISYCPDLLTRRIGTKSLEGEGRDARFALLQGAITHTPKRRHRIAGRPVLLVDDVMTSGATLAACAEACFVAGAAHVSVLTLARVAKDA
ncbi:ComF family protein [Cochlodiniinecator piscidefendens]|uniref:ComF family protein n=1 Tax=Cochlodiniinecator piscidefendens TaxID=2715756 RepID=UPI001407FC54|nr:ComF family protein [Cochlodiniinecator piscidefendens]